MPAFADTYSRITYQAAPGEEVWIKGSEIVTGWKKEGKGDVWKVTLPNSFFKDLLGNARSATVWGVCDQDSWLNNWPIVGRYDYATLITRNHRIKPVDFWIMKNY